MTKAEPPTEGRSEVVQKGSCDSNAQSKLCLEGQTTPRDITAGTFRLSESAAGAAALPVGSSDQRGVTFGPQGSAALPERAASDRSTPELSAPVKAGQGYYQVIRDMYKDMDPGQAAKLAKEARHLNGRDVLTQGEQFQMPHLPEGSERARSTERTPAGREQHRGRPDPESRARDQRAEETKNEFYKRDTSINDGLDAGRRQVPNVRSVMGLNEKDSAAVDKWMADPKNAGKKLGDAVQSKELHLRTPEQVEKAFKTHGEMVKDHYESKEKIQASLGGESFFNSRLETARNSELGVADQPRRQQEAVDKFRKEPWGNVPREQMTGLPDDKIARITEARANGDKRSVEQIGQSMGFFDDKRAKELSGLYRQSDFVHDRAVKENWQNQTAHGADPTALSKKAESVWNELAPTWDTQRQMTRPEAALTGARGQGSLTAADQASLGRTFRDVDRTAGPEQIKGSDVDSAEKFDARTKQMLEARSRLTGEKTDAGALDAEKKRILALNPGSTDFPVASADGKVNMYSKDQLHGWREAAAQNRVGSTDELVKYNSGGKVTDDMLRRANDLSAAYNKVDPAAPRQPGEFLKEMGADPRVVDSAAGWQKQLREGVHDSATKYNTAHPDRYTLPEVVGQDRKGAWNTVYQPVPGEGGHLGAYRGIDLREHTLQKFFEDPVKAGYAAAAMDPNHASLGRMFNVPEYDAMYKGKLAELQAKFGDAYEKKYGRPLDRIYFGGVDTGGAIKGAARADICVDKGTAKDHTHLNSPDGRKTFTMRFLSQDGKAMTIDSRGEGYQPEPVAAPPRRRRH